MTVDISLIIENFKQQIGDLSFQVAYLKAQVEMLQKQLEKQNKPVVLQEVQPNETSST